MSSTPLSWVAAELAGLAESHLLRTRREVTPLPGGRCEIDGRTLIDFSSNDYLGLSLDPRLQAAAIAATEQYGTGSRASALVSGRTVCHALLEEQLARFEHQQAAVLFPTGYAANLGVIPALVGPGDVVFCERLNHASLVDGCRASRARLQIFRSDRLDRLRTGLIRAKDAPRRLIVTDGVFSMDGTLAPLRPLCQFAREHRAMLLVDEAHGTGVHGRNGRGACEAAGCEGDQVTVRIGTLSKAIGSLGGFAVCSQELADWLWNRCRTQLFSTALPPASCAAASRALELIEQEPERRQQLNTLAKELTGLLTSAGISTTSTGGPIIPLIAGSAERAMAISDALATRGFLAPAIRPPTVPQGSSRLRISLSAAHSLDDVRQLAAELCDVWKAS
ncbi:MAG: 8-amino-7-oxononanoate synthase [Planctomycetaceae bacterium]|nr:8-amino-7-oxononanoate synthase [Planctomycetaceae bacterium]